MAEATWSHQNELDYAQSLIDGSAFDEKRPCKVSKRVLLENYVNSARKRIEYGTYVPRGEEIIKAVEKAIKEV